MKCEINYLAEIPSSFKVLNSTMRERREKRGEGIFVMLMLGNESPLHQEIQLGVGRTGENPGTCLFRNARNESGL